MLGLVLALSVALAPIAAGAQAGAPPPPVAPAPAAIPVPEIIERSDALLERLSRHAAELATDGKTEGIQASLASIGARLKRQTGDVDDLLDAGARTSALEPVDRALADLRVEVRALVEMLTDEATRLEAALDELATARGDWKLTRVEAVASGAPPATLERIDQTLGALATTRDVLRKRRARALEMQERASTDLTLVGDLISQVETYRREFASRIFQQDAPPIWRIDLSASARDDMVERFRTMLAAEWADAKRILPAAAPGLLLQVLLFVGSYLAFRTGRRRTKQWSEEDPTLETAATVFQSPISAALLLSLGATNLIYLRVPYLAGRAISLVALPAALHTLAPLVADRLRPALLVLGAFFVADRLRDISAPAPEVEQALLAIELSIALLLLLALLRSDRLEGIQIARDQLGRLRVLGWLVRGLALLVAGALGATVFGFMQLARALASGALIAVYSGFGLVAIARAIDGLIAFALRVRPLCQTRSVQRCRGVIEQRARRVTAWAAWGLFAYAVLHALQLAAPLAGLVASTAAIEFVPGDSRVKIGDVVFFAVILWASYQLARFVAFVLEHDVYPRFQLQRGLPYAISTLTRYALLMLGFFFAISALGIDLSKVTLLAGALGVGIGFGLQNIVNNFVSGLILLFERPIQVGDTVQIQSLTGEVRRIGLRASTLRTPDGAEVIVPNANLIQESVTNWTLSDNWRRVEVAVGVAYGTEPAQVVALLRQVADEKKEVLPIPEPVALFVGFGDSSLSFVLRCWLVQGENWVTVRSELHIAVHDALREAGIEVPFPQRDVHLKLDEAAAMGLAPAATSPAGPPAAGAGSAGERGA